MQKFVFLFILWTTKFLNFLIYSLNLGQASNFPGKIALVFKKDLIKSFNFKKETKIILISGTNGKSSTCGLLASILKASGFKVIYNKSGANLLSGITNAFCRYSNYFGYLNYDFIILEVDEATLPLLTNQIKPHFVAVTNFFRDQLDRFGELDTTVKLIEKGINNSNGITVILNADDPRVAFINTENKKIYYGIRRDAPTGCLYNGSPNWFSDPEEATICPECKSNLIFSYKTIAHLGEYKCLRCNLKRPEIKFLASNIKSDILTTNFDLIYNNQKHNYFLNTIGIFNLYNALCAIALAKTINEITPVQIQKGFQSYSTIFGRGEKITVETPRRGVSTVWIYLIKNPSGTTEVLKTLSEIPNARFLIAINDNFADGRDVSWLWDARFDILSGHKKDIFVSGKRAYDMAVRLKYGNIDSSLIKVNEKIYDSINNAIESTSPDETLYILPTYTALLEMQKKGICKRVPFD